MADHFLQNAYRTEDPAQKSSTNEKDDSPRGLFSEAWNHTENSWSHVAHGSATTSEYVEVAAEAATAAALGTVALVSPMAKELVDAIRPSAKFGFNPTRLEAASDITGSGGLRGTFENWHGPMTNPNAAVETHSIRHAVVPKSSEDMKLFDQLTSVAPAVLPSPETSALLDKYLSHVKEASSAAEQISPGLTGRSLEPASSWAEDPARLRLNAMSKQRDLIDPLMQHYRADIESARTAPDFPGSYI